MSIACGNTYFRETITYMELNVSSLDMYEGALRKKCSTSHIFCNLVDAYLLSNHKGIFFLVDMEVDLEC